MKSDVHKYVEGCLLCQQTKYQTSKTQGLLQPLLIPSCPWTDITMDFIVSLPLSKGYTAILVVIDRLTKVAHLGALKPGYTASTVAGLFTDIVVKHHGFPRTIITYRDPIFLNHFWRNLLKCSGTSLHYSTSYHPQTDGQTEVLNRCIEQYLRIFTYQQPQQWHHYLIWAEFCYNTSFHSAIGMTTHQALYGFSPMAPPSYQRNSSHVDVVNQLLLD